MKPNKFVVTQFKNSNGTTAWRVDGRLHGVRIRKNFKTREEAAAEKASLEIKALQTSAGMRQIATTLTEEQAREAEALFQRMTGKTHSLSFYVDFAIEHYREPEHQKTLAAAIAEYVAAKEHEFDQQYISLPQLNRITWDLRRLEKQFPKKSVAEITVPELVVFLGSRKPCMKTFNNQRGTLGTFFKFCFHRGWVTENPILKVPHYRIRQRRGAAKTFSTAQAQELMEHFETFEGGRWIPYFALCLFAGIRPGVPDGEITKIKPEDVSLKTGIIHVSAEASKVREPRKIVIQPNLAAWLRAYPLDKFPIVVGDFQKRRAKFKDRFHLTHDVLRHTFISMFVGKFRSIGEAAIQAGNSESIIRKHYLDLKSTEEAEAFFSIMPKHVALPLAATQSSGAGQSANNSVEASESNCLQAA
ncbi:site-specific integrase [Termitidicoccus mucosus]|uniref:tyrosine-type recombinase/integrase n=1 Tax=Termitidicoccus mucosus TaxID=1184151 RepID=UPI0011AB3CAF